MLSSEQTETELRDGVVAFDLTRDLITVTGPDAMTYLQGQISQDVERMRPGTSAWSFVLEPQGKVAAWFRISRFGDEGGESPLFVIDVDHGHGDETLARLARFKLRTKADFELLASAVVAVRGPLAERPPMARTLGFEWGAESGFDVWGDDRALVEALPRGSAQDHEVFRIRHGIPAMGAELESSTIPAEAGVVDQSVSFTKGCYVGQELVARVDSRGNNTPRRLRGFLIEGDDLPDPGAELQVNDDVAGQLTSVGRSCERGIVALGYLKRAFEDATSVSVLARSGVSLSATVMAFPF